MADKTSCKEMTEESDVAVDGDLEVIRRKVLSEFVDPLGSAKLRL